MKFTEDCLFVASTPFKLAEELAGWFVAQALGIIENGGPFCAAISGGNTPILFFNQLAGKFGHQINWNKIHFFWPMNVAYLLHTTIAILNRLTQIY